MALKLKSLGTVIATRRLALRGKYTVTVKIGKPRKFPTPPADYYCPFQITGMGDQKIRHVAGVDAVQALILALQLIGSELYNSKEYRAGILCPFSGDPDRNLGFPTVDAPVVS